MRVFLLLALLMPMAAQQDDLRQGLTALSRNDLPHAIEFLENAAKQDPKNAIAWVALAQAYAKSGSKDRALKAAASAAEFGAGAPPVQHTLAIFYAGVGDFPKAAEWEVRYLAAPAATAEAVSSFSQTLLNGGNFAEAVQVLEKAQGRFPENAQIALAWGVACYAQRRPSDAVDAFLRVIRLDDSIVQPYVFLGRILEHAGDRLPEVLRVYAAWETKDPGNSLPVFLHAKAMLSLPDPAVAEIEKKLRRSIELNAEYWESHLELGTLLLGQGKLDAAESELMRAGELNPGEPRPHYDLAKVYLRQKKAEKAKEERATYERLKTKAVQAPAQR